MQSEAKLKEIQGQIDAIGQADSAEVLKTKIVE